MNSAAIWLTGPSRWGRTLTTRIADLPDTEDHRRSDTRGCCVPGRRWRWRKSMELCVGESLVGEGNEVAHIDLIMGPRGSVGEAAFAHALTNNKDGFTSLLAVVAPNLLTEAGDDHVQQGHHQGCEAGRANVRPGAARGCQSRRGQRRRRCHPRKTKPTTSLSASACSSIGMPPTTRRSRNTIIAPSRKRSRAPSTVSPSDRGHRQAGSGQASVRRVEHDPEKLKTFR